MRRNLRWPWERSPEDTLRETYDAIQQAAQNRAELRRLVTTLHTLLVDELEDVQENDRGADDGV